MNFKITSASIIGKSHYNLNYNNQDALKYYQNEDLILGVICDGCGSGAYSEVGANLGANYFVNYFVDSFINNKITNELINNFEDEMIVFFNKLIELQKNNEAKIEDFIFNYLYFTILGFVVTEDITYIISSGDGFYKVNENCFFINQENKPKYLANKILNKNYSFNCYKYETEAINLLSISSDGIHSINEHFMNSNLENISTFSEIFDFEGFYDNEIEFSKFLKDLSINKNILTDDTSIIMLKRI